MSAKHGVWKRIKMDKAAVSMFFSNALKSSTYCNEQFPPHIQSGLSRSKSGHSAEPGRWYHARKHLFHPWSKQEQQFWALNAPSLLMAFLLSPGDEWTSHPPDFSFLSFSLKRGKRSETTAHCRVFLNKDTPRVEFHVTCRQSGNSNFCSHDSTVIPHPSSVRCCCCVAQKHCREQLQDEGILGWRSKQGKI